MVVDTPLYEPVRAYLQTLASRRVLVEQLRDMAASNQVTVFAGDTITGKSWALRQAFPEATYVTCALPAVFFMHAKFGYSGTNSPSGARPLDVPLHRLPVHPSGVLVLEESGGFERAAKEAGLKPRDVFRTLLERWKTIVLETQYSVLDTESKNHPSPRKTWLPDPKTVTREDIRRWRGIAYQQPKQKLEKERFFNFIEEETGARTRAIFNPLLTNAEAEQAARLAGFSRRDAPLYAQLVGGHIMPYIDGSHKDKIEPGTAFTKVQNGKIVGGDLSDMCHYLQRSILHANHSFRVAYRDSSTKAEPQFLNASRMLREMGVTDENGIRCAIQAAAVKSAFEKPPKHSFGPPLESVLFPQPHGEQDWLYLHERLPPEEYTALLERLTAQNGPLPRQEQERIVEVLLSERQYAPAVDPVLLQNPSYGGLRSIIQDRIPELMDTPWWRQTKI